MYSEEENNTSAEYRNSELIECEYNVCSIFGSDITEENILNLIQNFGKDIVRPYRKL